MFIGLALSSVLSSLTGGRSPDAEISGQRSSIFYYRTFVRNLFYSDLKKISIVISFPAPAYLSFPRKTVK
ncbi:hypothetical protein AS29_010300 [Bacillus sp. SJS]|nr:hypothetical protein AS29_010300 [Bacillus sp. SJS]